MNKICRICKCDSVFSKSQLKINNPICKKCYSTYYKKYYEDKRSKISESKKKYYLDNKDKILLKSKISYNKDIKSIYNKKYYKLNKIKISFKNKLYYQKNKYLLNNKNKSYRKMRRKRDNLFKLKTTISSIISASCKKNLNTKYLPYSIQQLKIHLESLFESWMNWENHGKYNINLWNDNDMSTWTWQIDHIIPQSHFTFKTTDDESFKKCWALSNLRPLSAKQNVIDGARKY